MASNRVALDLDGTLAQWCGEPWSIRRFGPPYPGAVEFVSALVAAGYEVVIHTCRCLVAEGDPEAVARLRQGCSVEQTAADIRAWLASHGFPECEVHTDVGKPFATWYVDDRGVRCDPEADPSAYEGVLRLLVGEEVESPKRGALINLAAKAQNHHLACQQHEAGHGFGAVLVDEAWEELQQGALAYGEAVDGESATKEVTSDG